MKKKTYKKPAMTTRVVVRLDDTTYMTLAALTRHLKQNASEVVRLAVLALARKELK